MGRRLLGLRYAVTTDAADTSIIWRLILLIRDADLVSVCWMNPLRIFAGQESNASSLWWLTIIRAAVNFGSAPATKRSLAPLRWELIFSIRLPPKGLIFFWTRLARPYDLRSSAIRKVKRATITSV